MLNLPKLIKRTTDNQSIGYIYDANGRKLRKLVVGGGRDYVDGIEYGDNGEIDFFHTPEVRDVKSGSSYIYEYFQLTANQSAAQSNVTTVGGLFIDMTTSGQLGSFVQGGTTTGANRLIKPRK